MKQSSSKKKPRVYMTAEERGLGRGDKVAASLAVYTPTPSCERAATHCGLE